MKDKFPSLARTAGVLSTALLLAGGAVPAQAQAQAEAAGGGPRIAVIDMGKVSGQSLLGKHYAAELEKLRDGIESERTKKQNQLKNLESELQTLLDEIEKQQSVLSAEALGKKQKEVNRKKRQRQALMEDGQLDIQRMTERAQQQAQNYNLEFQQKIRPHIDAVVKEKGIDILLDSQVALAVNPSFDISQDVVVRADDAEKKNAGGGGR